MPTCNAEASSIPLYSNFWENCACEKLQKSYHRLNRDQFYEGECFRDSLHGQGAYTWKNVAVYEGGFYSNSKEGYASLSFADNSYFEGLFVKNQPFGPGILTYANGRQDAGFWMGKKLIRLSRAVDYIIPRLASTPVGKIKLLQFKRLLPLNEEFYDSTTNIMEKLGCMPINFPTTYSRVIYDPRSIFFDNKIFENTFFGNNLNDEFIKDAKDLENGIRFSGEFNGEEDTESLEDVRVPSHCLCQQDVFDMKYDNIDEVDICDRESMKGELEVGILGYFTKFGMTEEDFFENEEVEESQVLQKNDEEDESKRPKILLWNRSELCKEIFKQMFRYRGFEEKLNFNLPKLMLGVRTTFRRTGEKEKQCLQLLKMCSLGPPHVVKDLLCSHEISQDLMDGRGNNSLMFAAATDQHEIMDILLDYGVDANTFNDEGLTPLNLCLLRRLALTNKICSWETAFLPQEADESLFPNNILEEELQVFQSIASLDRIFGDGMSLHDSNTLIPDNQLLALLPTQAFFRESSQSLKIRNDVDNVENFNLSQISLFNLLKSPKDYNMMPTDAEENRLAVQKLNSFCSFQTIDPSQGVKSNEPTLKMKFIPKPIKRDEFERSIQKASTDKYLFEFTIKKNPNLEGSKKEKEKNVKSSKGKSSRPQEKVIEEPKEEDTKEKENLELELCIKLAQIDKTIEKLLKRGADPNISDVPKPTIHLGVYTKDLKTICVLLRHGACPNFQLYANEGLLTPLHVIVLQEPDQINVQICEILLNFGADPELETSPEFSMPEEKNLLDSECGRTPLQLLCMRPDLEYADPFDNLIRIGLLLAGASNKKHFYNGHSCLTLAMLSGNFKILKALLESKFFDPNDILGKDRGTTLHVLVSTELQKVTAYENSIKMCDLLIAKGADPLKNFKHPKKLMGTCVDYGYREIEAEKEARKAATPGKKDSKPAKPAKGQEKTAVKDYLKDHERVVMYLGEIASNMAKNKETDGDARKNYRIQKRDLEDGTDKSSKGTGGKEKNKRKETPFSENQERKEISSAGKTESKKENSEIGDRKKDFPDKFQTVEKKENTKIKNEITSFEDKEKLKRTKRKKSKDVDGYLEKRKSSLKRESEKIKKHKTRKSSMKTSNEKNKKAVSPKNQGVCLERFPEKFRQVFLHLYGTGFNIDVNELIVPYVVLRNGELYYKFHHKPASLKEQYSLV